jgi:probable HAF family extracellular repeat protein
MKRIHALLAIGCGLLFVANTCFAQMYTVSDLGVIPVDKSVDFFGDNSQATGINETGQVVGASMVKFHLFHAWRTAANRPINPATDDLGTRVTDMYSEAAAINNSGRVAGTYAVAQFRSFRTAPNRRINPATDDLGALGINSYSHGYSINASGQVVGVEYIYDVDDGGYHAFRTAPNKRINPATDELGTLAPSGHNSKGSGDTYAYGINDSGQAVGTSDIGINVPFGGTFHAFRTAGNSPINRATDDLGTLGGTYSSASAINNYGQVVGASYLPGDTVNGITIIHAFRTASNSRINPATDDLGTIAGGWWTVPAAIDNYGQVVGWSWINAEEAYHAFVYSNGVMQDLNNLVSPGICELISTASGINDRGQIAANANCVGQGHAVRLDPVYKGFVQQPINVDGSSIFKAKRSVIPVKFRLTQYGARTCDLLPATISVTRVVARSLIVVDENRYGGGTNFRITGCQYHYNLAASLLGVGNYRVGISINGIMVGHAVFTLK